MKSNSSVTYEIDDLAASVNELVQGVLDGFPLLKNSVGLLFCYSDMEAGELAARMAQAVRFPVVGCTAIATMERRDGFHAIAATFTVLTADDCDFSVGLSDPITPENVAGEIEKTYAAVTAGLPGTPGLLFALPPYLLEIMLDEYSDALGRLAPGVPVIGGLPSYNGNGDENLTLCGGRAYPNRLVILAVGGNVRPVFSVQSVRPGTAERKRRVTEARGNVIYRVGEQTFTDYLAEIGMPVEKLVEGNNTVAFVSNPLLLEHTKAEPGDSAANGSSFAYVRTLHEIDLEKGSGTAIGRIPMDATLSVCPLHRDEIAQAALEGIDDLRGKIAAGSGYAYSTVLAVSCIGRHLLMSPNSSVEVDNILSRFPDGLTFSGFYSYGELGPLSSGDESRNFAHNESLVLCAF